MLEVGEAGTGIQVDPPCSAPEGWVGTDGTVEVCVPGWAWRWVELNQLETEAELNQLADQVGTDKEPKTNIELKKIIFMRSRSTNENLPCNPIN